MALLTNATITSSPDVPRPEVCPEIKGLSPAARACTVPARSDTADPKAACRPPAEIGPQTSSSARAASEGGICLFMQSTASQADRRETPMTETPRVRQRNRCQASIDDYFQDAIAIWERDRQGRSALDLWLYVVDHATRMVEAVRKERPVEVIDELADTAMWLFSFLAQCRNPVNEPDHTLRIDLEPSDLIWNKYPGTCPACFDFLVTEHLSQSSELLDGAKEKATGPLAAVRSEVAAWAQQYSGPATCQCLSRIALAEDRHRLFRHLATELEDLRLHFAQLLRASGHKPASISDIEAMFSHIFQNAYAVFPFEKVAFHLLEEVGEVSQAIKAHRYWRDEESWSQEAVRRGRLRLQEEVADVFSWLFATLLKIRSMYEDAQKYIDRLVVATPVERIAVAQSITFSEVVWSRYGRSMAGEMWEFLKCPRCEGRACACHPQSPGP